MMRMKAAGADAEVAEGLDTEEEVVVDIEDTTSVAEAVTGGGNLRVLTKFSLHSAGVLSVIFLGLLAVSWKITSH